MVQWHGFDLPDEIQAGNVVMRWKEEPAINILDDETEPTTYADAVKRQGAVFEEEGIYRNNYFFIRTFLRQQRVAVLPRKRKDWTDEQKAKYRRGEYDEFLRRLYDARLANREHWYPLKIAYKEELEDASELVVELYEAEEEARKQAEIAARAAEAERKRREAEAAEERRRAFQATLDAKDRERAAVWVSMTDAERPGSRSECEDRLRAMEAEFYANGSAWGPGDKEEYDALRAYHRGTA